MLSVGLLYLEVGIKSPLLWLTIFAFIGGRLLQNLALLTLTRLSSLSL